ncbi:leukotriene B4 receptor 1-like, partial [Sinocyclocheilus grahami]|uniref:leukotriene B4 receptor 1-like n=1 Tax=Sinocyclocheilus grahami TaxID=75366 RepID=UPI0007AD14D1
YSIVGHYYNSTNGLFSDNERLTVRSLLHNSIIVFYEQGVFQYTLETVVGFLVPYVIIVSSYACILRRLRQTMFKRRIRSENLIQAIIVTFCIFWLPYHCINIVQVAAALTSDGSLKKRLDNIWQSSRAVMSALAFISSCANPVLYAFAGRSYIKADGLAFMARLFEGTVLDYGARRSRQNGDVIRL